MDLKCLAICMIYVLSNKSQTILLTTTSLFFSDFFATRLCDVDINTKIRKQYGGFYVCPNSNCIKSFDWKGNLTRHLKYECGLMPRFKCPYCKYCCKAKADVKKHIIRRHKDHAVYVVDILKNSYCTSGMDEQNN